MSVNRLTPEPHLLSLVELHDTMRRGPVEAEMRIESRSFIRVARRGDRRDIPSPLVGGPGAIGRDLDPRLEHPAGLVGLDRTICDTRSRRYRRCNHREPHVFNCHDFPLRTMAHWINASLSSFDPDIDLYAPRAQTQRAFRNSRESPWTRGLPGSREFRLGRLGFVWCGAELAEQSRLARARESRLFGCLRGRACGSLRGRCRHGVV